MPQPVDRRPIWAIVNLMGERAADAVHALEDACAARGLPSPTIAATSPEEAGTPQAEEALRHDAQGVVVIGGDGTVRAVAEALSGSGVPLGIIASGTANLFARNLDLPRKSLRRAAVSAIAGTASPVDLGIARIDLVGGERLERRFLIVAGLGHDAESLADVDPRRKRRIGWLAYLAPGVRRFGRALIPVLVSIDDEAATDMAVWSMLVHNAARLPAGVRVIPGTRLDDGLLHVVAVTPRRVRDWLPIAASGLGLGDAEGILRARTATRTRLSPREPALVQLDGDPIGVASSLEVAIEPGALSVRRRIT